MSAGARIWRNPVHLLACGLGLGLAPFAAGTFGTLLGIPLFLALRDLPLSWYLAVVLALFALGVWVCEITARDLRVHDHPAIVWDEVVGFLLTMTAAPFGWGWILLGFVVFRIFDIAKPWPIRAIDRGVGGGFGIMLDDLMGGFYGLLTLQLIHALLKTP
ncbi:MAG: phosphatidylglycerophosphatase A [Gammaproteobacteria bacterium]|nr:phosphatidylglycerophosphatase A [Gammaproteobacteria bacterium]NIR85127.1 phosphatidylglycerophosphatase A [Gammaproteobacteria bacterium]NIR92056.1 phosphatidylglycerophosphatase A [Gammaproteobacteria bacterium]NIU06176.1 phosphatidylglycerophosphatase A [Gammaproteobacteria bacterium]NIV53175.1 phosphatidylglycerophosphatase A [Gammaproteobacteria bacterium]